jgi:hypothetical protein
MAAPAALADQFCYDSPPLSRGNPLDRAWQMLKFPA